MPQANIRLNVRPVNAKVSVIDIDGEITAFAENALMDAYTRASSPTTRIILLNFSRLEYMNSSGIGLLATMLMRADRQKQHLFAIGMSDHYHHIFRLTQLDDAIKLYPSEVDALAAAARCASSLQLAEVPN